MASSKNSQARDSLKSQLRSGGSAIAPYKYGDLEANKYTRLLQLHAGNDSDLLECNVFKVKLEDLTKLKYDAISYVWGQDAGSSHISCYGKSIPISKSLDIALRHLRSNYVSIILWTDQICINQANNEEKDWHIPHMAGIYRNANHVLIWLGAGDDQSNLAMDSFPGIIANLEARDHKKGVVLPEEQGWSDSQLDAINYLLQKPWFTRVWTLLEAAMARKCRIVCGDRKIDFAFLMMLNEKSQNDGMGHWKDVVAQLGADSDLPQPSARYVTSHLQAVYRLRESERRDTHNSRRDDLPRLLHHVRTCGSTDQRDRVYALYHFLPAEIKEVIDEKSKYTGFSVESLFTRVAAVDFLKRQNIELLSTAGLAQQKLELPSWVPDWTFPVRHHSFTILNQDCLDKGHGLMFQAGGEYPANRFRISDGDRVLMLQAKRIGRITSLAKPWKIHISNLKRSSSQKAKLDHIEKEAQSRQQQIEKCIDFARSHEPFDAELDTLTACRRVLTAGMRQLGGGSSMDGPLVPVSDATIAADFEALEPLLQQLAATNKAMLAIGDPIEYQAKMQNLLTEMQQTTSRDEYEALAEKFDKMSAHFISAVQAPGSSVDIDKYWNHASTSSEDSKANVDQFKREVWEQHVQPMKDPMGMWGTLWDTCKARIFFIMERTIPIGKSRKAVCRYMGLAPDMAELGDIIAVVIGCPVPFLFRPVGGHGGHGRNKGSASYRLIGECYVLGFMTGEAIEMSDIDTEEIAIV